MQLPIRKMRSSPFLIESVDVLVARQGFLGESHFLQSREFIVDAETLLKIMDTICLALLVSTFGVVKVYCNGRGTLGFLGFFFPEQQIILTQLNNINII
jgi:hypothetical protein